MKKYNIILIVLLSLIGFTSCEDTKDPEINEAALDGSLTFKLNQTRYINYVLEDANATTDMDALTCVQPDYGFTAAVTYTTQVCFNSNFAAGTFQSLPTTINGEKVGINTKEMDVAIINLYGGSLPTQVVEKNVYIRLKAFISDATATPLVKDSTVKPLYSNAIMLKILPYVLPLFPYTEVTPRLWYIVGLADGAWNNSIAGIGSSLIPLSLSPGKKYNLSGDGEFIYTGYFKAASGFKLVRDFGWTEQWGMTGSTYTYKSGDNITVPINGYYTITLNSIDNKLTIVPADAPPASYTAMGLIGDFNGWGTDVVMATSETTNNHVWYTTHTFVSDFNPADGGCKFRANGNWTVAWGGSSFPFAIGTSSNGANIKFKAGTYAVTFNDADGCYYFIKK